jgi:hypothetical protein
MPGRPACPPTTSGEAAAWSLNSVALTKVRDQDRCRQAQLHQDRAAPRRREEAATHGSAATAMTRGRSVDSVKQPDEAYCADRRADEVGGVRRLPAGESVRARQTQTPLKTDGTEMATYRRPISETRKRPLRREEWRAA